MNTRIRVPETAAPGEIVEIRAMAMHPMDNGFMVTTQGATPRDRTATGPSRPRGRAS